jgi:hypothetical protein
VGGNGLSTREGAAALEKMCVAARHHGTTYCLLLTAYCLLPTADCRLPTTRCVALRQKRHMLATEMARHPDRQRELEDARYGVSRAEGGLQLLTAVIDGGQLTGGRVVDLLAELRHLEEREMAELLPMEEAIARNERLDQSGTVRGATMIGPSMKKVVHSRA